LLHSHDFVILSGTKRSGVQSKDLHSAGDATNVVKNAIVLSSIHMDAAALRLRR
jgi:hypothetical protein